VPNAVAGLANHRGPNQVDHFAARDKLQAIFAAEDRKQAIASRSGR
jgi:hypothetical protein